MRKGLLSEENPATVVDRAIGPYPGGLRGRKIRCMSSLPDSRRPVPPGPAGGPFQLWTQTLLIVLIAAAAVYLITNHWLHVLDALPYLGVVLVMGFCMFGHGSHGGHGSSHRGHGGQDGGEAPGRPGTGGGTGHVH